MATFAKYTATSSITTVAHMGTGALMDVVTDFNAAEGDILDVNPVDADIYTAGDQAFRFIGQGAFTLGQPGEISYVHSGGNTIIQFQTGESPDVDGASCCRASTRRRPAGSCCSDLVIAGTRVPGA